jgi:hypothetical protein
VPGRYPALALAAGKAFDRAVGFIFQAHQLEGFLHAFIDLFLRALKKWAV